MKLVEVIPTKQTLPEVTTSVSAFASEVLGKGVVGAKKLLPGFSSREIVLNPDSTDLAQAARQPKQHQNQYYEPERRPPCIAPARMPPYSSSERK